MAKLSSALLEDLYAVKDSGKPVGPIFLEMVVLVLRKYSYLIAQGCCFKPFCDIL